MSYYASPCMLLNKSDGGHRLVIDYSKLNRQCQCQAYSIAACLFQVIDGLEHPICYITQKLNKHQVSYSTIEKETFILLTAVQRFSIYFGTNQVTQYTDHDPLQFLHKMKHHNQKLMRWKLQLQDYNLVISHPKGKQNVLPYLVCRPSE